MLDPHDLSPGGVMSLLPTLGGAVDRILVVGCRPGVLDDGIGLSPVVEAAVEPAAELVRDVVRRELDRLHPDPALAGGGG
jgi:hydrogenase maturation protease